MSQSVLMSLFKDISDIPRASFQEKEISDYLVSFGNKLGLETNQDAYNNVLIKKPASAGYENAPVVMLQSHVDMVAEKNKNSSHNFDKDPIELIIEGNILRANNTTLGADDGVGVVYMMALLQDEKAQHPALECVFTVEEEVGLIGATNFDTSTLEASLCIGLDSSGEKEVYVSSSGGVRGSMVKPIAFNSLQQDTLKLGIRGLHGGHSGGEIDQERGNAIKLAGIILKRAMQRFSIQLVMIDGGLKINAIPREVDIEFVVDDKDGFLAWFKTVEQELLLQYEFSDSGLNFVLDQGHTEQALSLDDTKKIVDTLFMLPYGVIQKSKALENLVITSSNIGTVSVNNNQVEINVSLRATQGFVIENIMEQVSWIGDIGGFEVSFSSRYPGWNFDKDSKLRERLKEVHQTLRHEAMLEVATHGGVELGIWKGKMPHLDIASLGPIMYDIHTPNEHLDIASFERTYEVLYELLKSLNNF